MTIAPTNTTTADAMSFSEASTLDCWRKHHFQYVEGLRPKRTTPALRTGKVFDAYLNEWYGSTSDIDHHDEHRFTRAMTALGDALAEEAGAYLDAGGDAATIEQDATTLVSMAFHYVERWGAEPYLTCVDVQTPLDVALRTDTGRASTRYRAKGFVDAIMRDADGRLILWENKTTARIDAGYRASFTRSKQLLWYAYALREMGQRPDAIVVNVTARAMPKWPALVAKGDRLASIVKAGGAIATATTPEILDAAISTYGLDPADYTDARDAVERDAAGRWFWRREFDVSDAMLDAAGSEWLQMSKLRRQLPPIAMPSAVKCAMCAFAEICPAPSLDAVADIVAEHFDQRSDAAPTDLDDPFAVPF